MGRRWRLLVLGILIGGCTNLFLLHSLTAQTGSTLHQTDKLASSRSSTKSSRHEATPSIPKQPHVAVLHPVSDVDRSLSAAVAAFEELNFRIVYCPDDLLACVGRDSTITERGGFRLLWLRAEGDDELPESMFAGARAVNAFGVGWQMWSRRSLCLAMQQNRAEFKNGNSKYIAWYPECLTLPSQLSSEDAVATVRSSSSPWVIHGSKSRKNHVFESGSSALDSAESGVLHQYISPPLTFDGLKFTLFAYAAVTSLNPLRAYLFQDAHVMLARHRYASKSGALAPDDALAHTSSEVEAEAMLARDGGLWGPRGVMQALKQTGLLPTSLWRSVEDAVAVALLTAATASPEASEGGSSPPTRSQFKLLGVHLVFDAAGTAFVIKLDPSPPMRLRRSTSGGLSAGSELRKAMLQQLLRLVGVSVPEGGEELDGEEGGGGREEEELRERVVRCVEGMREGGKMAKQLQPKHLNAIVALERERKRLRHTPLREPLNDTKLDTNNDAPESSTPSQGDRWRWSPLYPVSGAVEKIAAQVRGGRSRAMDTLMRWWVDHGRERCLPADNRE